MKQSSAVGIREVIIIIDSWNGIGDSHPFLAITNVYCYTDGMPRTARIVLPQLPHHVTQRGNNRAPVFFQEADYRRYLGLLTEQTAKCQMKNTSGPRSFISSTTRCVPVWYHRLPSIAGAARTRLLGPDDEALLDRLRLATHTGRPLGNEAFISEQEACLGRRLHPLPVGRPRMKAQINNIR